MSHLLSLYESWHFCHSHQMHTNLHNASCVFVGAQRHLVFIAEAMQCTHNGLESTNTLCMTLNYLLEEGLELREMQYAHIPEACCRILTKYYGQWL